MRESRITERTIRQSRTNGRASETPLESHHQKYILNLHGPRPITRNSLVRSCRCVLVIYVLRPLGNRLYHSAILFLLLLTANPLSLIVDPFPSTSFTTHTHTLSFSPSPPFLAPRMTLSQRFRGERNDVSSPS